MRAISRNGYLMAALLTLAALLAGCAGASPPTATPGPTATNVPRATHPVPTNPPATTAAPTATIRPVGGGTATATPAPTAAPTATTAPAQTASAQDSMVLAMPEEPAQINPMMSLGASTTAYITRDNVAEPLTWQSGDDQRIVPTSATESWTQTAPDTWHFTLRQGVKFSDGEPFNAQAAIPTLEFLGVGLNNNSSYPYTGGFTPRVVDDYTLELNCDQDCPILPNTAFFTGIQSPKYIQEHPTPDDRARSVIGFGPYVLKEWQSGVSITQEAYEDYVPVGDHYEFQKPKIKNLTWVWRSETTVLTAMVKSGEADLAWDVGVDAAKDLSNDMIAFGSSAEVFAMTNNTLWHPELKKVKVRQAINHAINCQEIVDTIYNGATNCVGNLIWLGVIGSTEENTRPYDYDPEKARQLLQEAGYNPDNEIGIYGRVTRIPKQLEVYEAYQSYLTQVGINAKIYPIEAGVRTSRTACGIGKTVNQVLLDSGRDPAKDTPTRDDFRKAIERGPLCPYADLMENEPSNETLDFGRQANYYMNCIFPRSLVCDPEPGGYQDQLPEALAAAGADRQAKMQRLADDMHNLSLFTFAFELPVVYAKDAKLNFRPRFDGRIRANHLWFNP